MGSTTIYRTIVGPVQLIVPIACMRLPIAPSVMTHSHCTTQGLVIARVDKDSIRLFRVRALLWHKIVVGLKMRLAHALIVLIRLVMTLIMTSATVRMRRRGSKPITHVKIVHLVVKCAQVVHSAHFANQLISSIKQRALVVVTQPHLITKVLDAKPFQHAQMASTTLVTRLVFHVTLAVLSAIRSTVVAMSVRMVTPSSLAIAMCGVASPWRTISANAGMGAANAAGINALSVSRE